MASSVRSVSVRLSAEVSGYIAGMRSAGKATKDALGDATKYASANKTALNDLGSAAGKMGLAAAAGVAIATKRFADFDSQMSSVKAASGETGKAFEDLRQLALDLGADSQFSATEAAAGIENLSKAGVSTADIMGGALKGSLDLAAAGEIAVAEAAEYTATALTQFSLGGDQATHVADLLAAGAGKAQGEVTDMALALDYAGVPAANLGVTIEETAGTIALFAKNGIIGEKAGTSLRGMMASLTSPSGVASKEMEKLGISVFDASGKFIGFDGVAGQLRAQMKGLTDEERAYSMGKIFGNEQMQAANVLYREGAKGVREMTTEVNDFGYASDFAATKTDNLKGDIERLGGAFDSLLIGSAEGANGPLRELVQGLTGVVDVANGMPAPVKSAGFAALGLTAIVGGLTYASTRAITAVAGIRANIDSLRTSTRGTTTALTSMDRATALRTAGKGAAVLGGLAIAQSEYAEKTGLSNTASYALMGTIAGPWGAAIGGGIGLVQDFAASNNDLVDATRAAREAMAAPINVAEQQAKLADLTKTYDDYLASADRLTSWDEWATFTDIGRAISEPFTNAAAEAEQARVDMEYNLSRIEHNVNVLADILQRDADPRLLDMTNAEMQEFVTRTAPALEAAGLDVKQVLEGGIGLPEAAEAVRSYIRAQDSLPGKTNSAADSFANLGNELKTAYEKAEELEDGLNALLEAAMGQDEANVAWQRSIRTLTKELKGGADALNVYTKRGQDNRDAIRSRIEDLQASILADAQAGVGQERLAAKLQRGREAILAAGEAANISEVDMREYLKELNLTPEIVRTLIEARTAQAEGDVLRFRGLLDGLNGHTVETFIRTTHLRNDTGEFSSQPPNRSGVVERAAGGPICGYGHRGTSDNLPIGVPA